MCWSSFFRSLSLRDLIDQFLLLCLKLSIELFILHELFLVHIWMLLEAVSHALELLNAVHALRFFLRVHEARECLPELWATGTVGHAAQAGTVPIDLSSLWIECALASGLFFKFTCASRKARLFCESYGRMVYRCLMILLRFP